MSTVAGLILAAGKGTRMKSELPKVLHEVCGTAMVSLALEALKEAGLSHVTVVIGHGGDKVQEELGDAVSFAWQHEQKGTGHAVRMAQEALLGQCEHVVVIPGDTPLLSGQAISQLLQAHLNSGAAASVLTCEVAEPKGYGRIVREGGVFARIVEEKDASPEVKAIREVNSGVYAFHTAKLFAALPRVGAANAQGEEYLTDVLALLLKDGDRVEALPFDDADILMGVNDRWSLAEADALLRRKILRRLADSGVTIVDPNSTYISPQVKIGPDTIIEPQTYITGHSVIGRNCHIGPSTRIKRSVIGDGTYVYFSHVADAELGDGVKVGPFAHLRPGTQLGSGTKIGNFVEVKNAQLGPKVSANHLSYIGDATVGAGTNIGAGTITCNYDGFQKHRTTIGENVFVGSNSTLVAPVELGNGSFVAAGSVITKNVQGDALAFGRARQEVKEGWAVQWRAKFKK